jgi:methylation protein EvaC
MTNCRICGSAIEAFMSFGKMPIANGFLTPDQIPNEYFFELAPAYCANCEMFQLMEQPAPEKMFHENYAFFSSTSRHMQAHFARFADMVQERALKERKDPFVVEIGSNDGIMLRHFKKRGQRHLGIEPSRNVANVGRAAGINTMNEFFNGKLARRIVEEYGHADAVLSANVMCHIPDIPSVAEGIRTLLKPDGMLIFEDPYLGDMVAKTSYDQIYDEHVFIFSASSVKNAFGRHGLDLIDVLPQVTHGGSMRYVLAPKGSHMVSENVATQIARERALGLDRAAGYQTFKRNCENSRERLMALLNELRAEKKKIVGYGATSKSTTVMNYCDIGPDHIAWISDTTPIKQGKLTPGTHIPVRPYEDFTKDYPEYAVLFAWNHAAEIREKETAFAAAGGKWIYFVPKVEIIA